MGRKKFTNKIKTLVWNKTNGYCWHCKKRIYKNDWNIDHYPVRYIDIKKQILLGVTDEHNLDNLVPSCVRCNVSHKYERKYYFYGNKSQCPCTPGCIFSTILFFIILSIYIFYLSKVFKINLHMFI